jgi:hypothetical protein
MHDGRQRNGTNVVDEDTQNFLYIFEGVELPFQSMLDKVQKIFPPQGTKRFFREF